MPIGELGNATTASHLRRVAQQKMSTFGDLPTLRAALGLAVVRDAVFARLKAVGAICAVALKRAVCARTQSTQTSERVAVLVLGHQGGNRVRHARVRPRTCSIITMTRRVALRACRQDARGVA